jgi:pimeloyl-ACP methyl ester carboxylesterase
MTLVRSGPVAHGWTSADGLRLHHLRWEGGDGTPIVCLHGVTGQAWAWNGSAPLLAERATVLAFDLRGHGASSWAPDGDYSTAVLAADLAAALVELGLATVDVVGLSWGGLVGATLAAARPDLVRSLVMVDVPPVFAAAVDEVPPRPAAFADLDAVIEFEQAANRHAPPEQVAVLAAGSVRPGVDALVRCHDPVFLTEWPFRAEDHWPAVRGVRSRGLVVRAQDSVVLSEELARAEADALGGDVVEIGPSGHLVPVDQPVRFAEVVLDFL